MSNKLVQLTIIKRYMNSGFLYLKTRAYRVDTDKADELCMLEHRDMPIFKVVSEAKLEAEEVPATIIDLTSGSLDESEELELDDDEVAKPTPAPKKKAAKKKAPKKKVSLKKKKATAKDSDSDVTMV